MIVFEGLTRRERIVEILRSSCRPLTIDEIALRLDISDRRQIKNLYDDMFHVAKSIYRNSGGKEMVVMVYPRCMDCGYIFKDLKKPRKPSKCPRCKSSRIEPPKFYLISRLKK